MTGHVVSIHITETAGGETHPVESVRAIAGRGLEGDRILNDAEATDSSVPPHRQVTLIEAEALEAVQREEGIELSAGESRRNICTRDLALNHFVDREFSVGAVRLRGIQLCEPCGLLQKLTGKQGLVKALLHRAGLRAEILDSGVIRVGDTVKA